MNDNSRYIAHKRERQPGVYEIQTVKEHLEGTAKYAKAFAEKFGAGAFGKCCGDYHDLGKYSEEFQKRIQEDGPKVDHATAGAKEIHSFPIQMAIAGHHSGLMDRGTKANGPNEKTLCGRLKRTIPDYSGYQSEIRIEQPQEKPSFRNTPGHLAYSGAFFTRMLYSSLVDADFLDTEDFMSGGGVVRQGFDEWETLYRRLEDKTQHFLKSKPSGIINEKRNDILQQCLDLGKSQGRGAYTLTVPTGGGKTIASLAFAMEQLKANGMDRIIYVIPYTSIIDQTVEAFEEILGSKNVLAHHSNVAYDDEAEIAGGDIARKKLATENWDAPVIVTTNVQFFESLHGHRSSSCRKLHNIADSIIIFDEAQMLPHRFLLPCLQSIGELVRNYRCTAVLCTATQPFLGPYFPEDIPLQEICRDTEALYEIFRRVRYERLGMVTQEVLTERINNEKQVLCIVNTRQQAYDVFRALKGRGNFHLSTWMMPKHRKRVLKKIRKRLKAGLPCRVISTSLVEAGVDLDFPTVYRAMAGLDSIIQAGGRCNREGKRPLSESIVWIFDLEGKPKKLKDYLAATSAVLPKHEEVDSPECIAHYFETLYHLKDSGLDAKSIIEKMEALAFETVSKDFELIDEESYSVFIPINKKAKVLLAQFRGAGPSRGLLRKMNAYMVSLPKYQYDLLDDYRRIENLDEAVSVLINLEDYTKEAGIKIPKNDLGEVLLM